MHNSLSEAANKWRALTERALIVTGNLLMLTAS